MGIMPAKNDAGAIALINDCAYGCPSRSRPWAIMLTRVKPYHLKKA